jgi:hypothetical protein
LTKFSSPNAAFSAMPRRGNRSFPLFLFRHAAAQKKRANSRFVIGISLWGLYPKRA